MTYEQAVKLLEHIMANSKDSKDERPKSGKRPTDISKFTFERLLDGTNYKVKFFLASDSRQSNNKPYTYEKTQPFKALEMIDNAMNVIREHKADISELERIIECTAVDNTGVDKSSVDSNPVDEVSQGVVDSNVDEMTGTGDPSLNGLLENVVHEETTSELYDTQPEIPDLEFTLDDSKYHNSDATVDKPKRKKWMYDSSGRKMPYKSPEEMLAELGSVDDDWFEILDEAS